MFPKLTFVQREELANGCFPLALVGGTIVVCADFAAIFMIITGSSVVAGAAILGATLGVPLAIVLVGMPIGLLIRSCWRKYAGGKKVITSSPVVV